MSGGLEPFLRTAPRRSQRPRTAPQQLDLFGVPVVRGALEEQWAAVDAPLPTMAELVALGQAVASPRTVAWIDEGPKLQPAEPEEEQLVATEEPLAAERLKDAATAEAAGAWIFRG